MLEAIHFLRRGIISKLTNAVSVAGSFVPVYNRIPTDAQYPLIRVYSVSTDEADNNQSSFITETITRIECITRFYSDDGGELDTNLMVSQCLELIRTRSGSYVDLNANGFNVFTSVNKGVKYFENDLSDYTYFRAIIEVSNKIEQIAVVPLPTETGLQSELQLEFKNDYVNRVNADGGELEALGCIDTDFLYNLNN